MARSSTATDPLLSCAGLSYRYGDGEFALRDANLTLSAGSVTALVGDNGSGKSTLLKLLAGRLRASEGELLWRNRHAPMFSSLGYVAQMPELDPEMTGVEHLALMAALMTVPRALRSRSIATCIQTWQLKTFIADRVSTYSGGMRRRLHLALGFVHSPELWLLDEPSTGLDPERQEVLWRQVHAHAEEGGAVVLATHDLSAVDELATSVLRLERGLCV